MLGAINVFETLGIKIYRKIFSSLFLPAVYLQHQIIAPF